MDIQKSAEIVGDRLLLNLQVAKERMQSERSTLIARFPDVDLSRVRDEELRWVSVFLHAGVTLDEALGAVSRVKEKASRFIGQYEYHQFNHSIESMLWRELERMLSP